MAYHEDETLRAVTDSYGIVSRVAERLGCTRQTVYNLMARFPSVAKAMEVESKRCVDLAKESLVYHLQKKDKALTAFTLKTKGKDEGWTERQEISGPDGSEVIFRVIRPEDEDAEADG